VVDLGAFLHVTSLRPRIRLCLRSADGVLAARDRGRQPWWLLERRLLLSDAGLEDWEKGKAIATFFVTVPGSLSGFVRDARSRVRELGGRVAVAVGGGR
jgi:hypothetical protein